MGFVLNQFDPCMANNEIEGSQHTMAWYVDAVNMVIARMKEHFGRMNMTREGEHMVLGMAI
jgi:hypothetical protein